MRGNKKDKKNEKKKEIGDEHLPNLANKRRNQLKRERKVFYTKKEFEKRRKKVLSKKLH